MKHITSIRKTVCTMANELKKSGYSLSQAFRKAWKRVKLSMTIRAAGTMAENRQERLKFLQQFPVDALHVTLERETNNSFDGNAIKIVIHILPIHRKTVIGYIPRELAKELVRVLDKGVSMKATLIQVIGGYSYKESLGALINIAV